MYVFFSVAIRYMEISMYLAICFVARYMEPCHMFHRKVHGNFHASSCHMLRCKVHGNFHVPCHILHGNARYIERILFRNTTATKHMARYVSSYVLFARYMEICMYLAICSVARYVKISMYLAMCFVARHKEIRYMKSEIMV